MNFPVRSMALQLSVTFAVFAAYGLWQRRGWQDKRKDFLGELPDDILSYIVSHLNMREAARTALLSRRWKCLYSSMYCLDFSSVTMFGPIQVDDHVCPLYVHKFVKVTNAYLKCYQGSAISSIRFSFCLRKEFAADIDQWLSFAVGMDVRELELCCSCKEVSSCKVKELYVVSFNLIANSSKLKQLRLDSCTIMRDFNGRFHSLCILDLSHTLLGQTDVQYILLTCVNLEQLRLHACTFSTNLSICGPLVRLKVLTLDHPRTIKGTIKFELSASSLITFEYFWTVIPFPIIIRPLFSGPSFSGVPGLKNLFIDTPQDNVDVDYLCGALERDVPQLESLSLFSRLEFPVAFYLRDNPGITFSNVKHLALYFHFPTLRHELLSITLPVLKACPLLVKFHLMLLSFRDDKEEPGKLIDKPRLTALKEVEFGGFHGSDNQIQWVKYLIKNAVSLEQLILSTGCRRYMGFGEFTHECKIIMDEERRRWILDQLELERKACCAQVKIQLELVKY